MGLDPSSALTKFFMVSQCYTVSKRGRLKGDDSGRKLRLNFVSPVKLEEARMGEMIFDLILESICLDVGLLTSGIIYYNVV